MAESLKKGRAGHRGEEQLAYHLGLLPEKEYYIIHDLRLKVNERAFQIDTLILCPTVIIVVECKNFAGTMFFDQNARQLIRIYDNKEEGFSDPLNQVKRQASQLQVWMESNKFRTCPIEAIVAVSNPNTILKATHNSVFQKVLHAENIPEKIKELDSKHTERILSPYHMRKLGSELTKQHAPLIPNILETYAISPSEILPGVICPNCLHRPLNRIYAKWSCPHCGTSHNHAHREAILDYLYLHHKITNKECSDFLQINSSLSKRLLLQMGLPYIGSTKDRTYTIPL